EAVLSIQGIIAKKDLPPFEEKISPNSSHAQYLRQSVTLVGFQQPTFQRTIDNILEIHAHLGRSVGHNNIETCGIIGDFEGQPSIEMTNRYFTHKRQAGLAKDITFSEHVDPKGYLENAKGRNYVHIEDNAVYYYEMTTDKFGENKFIPTKPVRVQVGDIVEAQISVILAPLRDKKYKSSMIIRSLSIIDGSYTQASQISETLDQKTKHTRMNSKPPGAILKRRVGYVDEELGMTKAKLSRMEIEDAEQADEGNARANGDADLD
ncbi:hypothetical protein CPB84DRAFT_1690100, partial [Gymnopilus junonius]